MAKLSLFKVAESQLESLPVKDGQFIVVTDKKHICLDNGTERIHLYGDEASKLASIAFNATKVESSTQNGYIKINGVETKVYTPSEDKNTTYTLSKSGSSIILTGSDGSTTSVTDTDTNTHYTSKNVVGSATATSNTTEALTNGNVYLVSVENGAVTSAHKISGSGATAVTTDASGNIIINSTDTNTTYGVATSNVLGLIKTGSNITNSNGTISLTKSNVTSALGYTPPTSNTTYSNFTGATSNANGGSGLVPAPLKGDQTKFLRADGTWVIPTDTKYTHPSYSSRSSGLYKITVDATGHVSAVTSVAKADITALGIPTQDTTYSAMGAATASTDGKSGLVPAPLAGASNRYLRSDGTWAVPPDTNTTYTTATTSASGLMSSADKTKLNGIATGANAYTHPAYTAKSAGFYKVTVDGTGHVSAATAVAKSDIIALGIPAQDTTYRSMTAATASAAGKTGLVPAPAAGAQTKFLRGDGTWQTPTNTTYSTMTGATSSANGTSGLVPAPTSGSANRYLRSDGTWQVPPDNNTVYTHPTTSGNKHIPSGGSSGQILRWSADGTAVWGADNNTTYTTFVKSGSGAKAGLVPAPSTTAGTTKYLREDGTWQTPPDTNTTYSAATTSSAGLMSASDKTKLNSINTSKILYFSEVATWSE